MQDLGHEVDELEPNKLGSILSRTLNELPLDRNLLGTKIMHPYLPTYMPFSRGHSFIVFRDVYSRYVVIVVKVKISNNWLAINQQCCCIF